MKSTLLLATLAALGLIAPIRADQPDPQPAEDAPSETGADPFAFSPRTEEKEEEPGSGDDDGAVAPPEGERSSESRRTRSRRSSGSTDEASPAPADAYRRPSLDRSLFDLENLTLDKDQVLETADLLARLVCTDEVSSELRDPVFQAHVLGIALRLDPRNQAAVVANNQLERGLEPRPVQPTRELDSLHKNLMTLAGHLLEGAGGTEDDRALGGYLADLGRRVYPDGDEKLARHESILVIARDVDWGAVLPPEAPSIPDLAGERPESQDDGGTPEIADQRTDRGSRGDRGRDRRSTGTTDREKIQLTGRITLAEVEIGTVALAGDHRSRAAQRVVTLRNRDYGLEMRERDGVWRNTRVPLEHRGPSRLVFSDKYSESMQERWWGVAGGEFARRFENFPTNTEIDVVIPGYMSNSGTSALLAVTLAAEGMVRGLNPDPKVSAIGTWNDEGRLNAHSHLPGAVLSYAKDWRPILVTPPGRRRDLEVIADYGLASPFLNAQVVELGNYTACADFVFGNRDASTVQALAKFEEIQKLRRTMEPQAILTNKAVQARLAEIQELMPNHLSSALLLRAAANQRKLSVGESIEVVSRLYRPLEMMAEHDMRRVPEREGLDAVEVFGERYREMRGIMDPSIKRLEIRFDDVTKIFSEVLRIKDRSTGTSARRIEQLRATVQEGRRAIDGFGN